MLDGDGGVGYQKSLRSTHLPQHFLHRLLPSDITDGAPNQSQGPPLPSPALALLPRPPRIDFTPSDQTDQTSAISRMVRICISRLKLRCARREARVGVLGIIHRIGSPIHVIADESAAFLERVWFLPRFFFFGGGVEVGKDQRGGFGQFELGVGFAGCEFEVVFQLGAEGVGVDGFGDVMGDVHWGGRPGMARRLVGD